MKKLIFFILFICLSIILLPQTATLTTNLQLQKVAPAFYLNGTGAFIDFYNGDVRLTQSGNTLTLSGGDFALAGGYSLLLTGSIGSTGSRILKGWFTNLESTNMITINGISLSTIFAATSHTQAQTTITGLPDSLLNHYTKAQTNTRLNLKANTSLLQTLYKDTTGIYNVLDYGADRTGATTSTTAIQSALNACDSGTVYFPQGYYLTGTLVIPNDNITIRGAGKYLTTLQLINDADIGTANGHLIYAGGKDNFTLRDIQLNGNGLNQTKVNNRDGTDHAMSIGVCLRDSVAWGYTNDILIENCYIRNFAARGIVWGKGDNCVITNCEFDNNFTAHIEFWGESSNGAITNCTSRNGCFITFFECTNHTLSNCKIFYPYNAQFHHDDEFAITLEATGSGPDNITISDVQIIGDTISKAIYVITTGLSNLSINNVYLKSSDPDGYGIITENDVNTVITNCHIIGTKYPIVTIGTQYATFSNNTLIGNATGYSGIYLNGNSDNNRVLGNNIIMSGGIGIELVAGATNNIVANNVVNGAWGDAQIKDAGTNSTIFNNYSVLLATMLSNIVKNNIDYTATVGGATSGIITPGSQNITVTSASANYICCLPVASSATIGTVITGKVGANGFELRVAASQATTVQLNGVTTNVEAAIPANTNFKVTQVDDNDWILECTTNLGAVLTAIIPDAI